MSDPANEGVSSSLTSVSQVCSYLDSLALIDERNVPFVEACLSHPDDGIRGCAARAVGRVGLGTDDFIDRLARLLRDKSVLVRQSAAAAVGNIGIAAKSSVPALADALLDEDPDVREFAALALKDMGEFAAPAVMKLAAALNDRNDWVRGAAAWALGELGAAAAVAAPQLKKALDNAHLWVRCRAAAALDAAGIDNEYCSEIALTGHPHCALFGSCSAGALQHEDPPAGCPLRNASANAAK